MSASFESLASPESFDLFESASAVGAARRSPSIQAVRIMDWPDGLPRSFEARLEVWLRSWDASDLASRLRIETSSRMRSSLGRAYLERRLVRLNHRLLDPAHHALLDEVFCHEVAHLVVHERHGRAAAPHGREWRTLLHEVGSPVRVTIPRDECWFLPPERRRRRRRRRGRRRCAPGRAARYPSLFGGLLSALSRLQGRLM